MSDAATRILEQLQAQYDLRMQAANEFAQAVAARVQAEQNILNAQATEKQAFANALKKGWTQQELNKISPARVSRKRAKKNATTTEGSTGSTTTD